MLICCFISFRTVAVNTSNADLQFIERLGRRLENEIVEIDRTRQKYLNDPHRENSLNQLNRFKVVVEQTVHLVSIIITWFIIFVQLAYFDDCF